MTGSALHASRNAGASTHFDFRPVLLPAAAALFLTLTEAFGLEVLPLLPRFLYWLVLLGLGQGASLLVRASLDRLQLSPAGLLLVGLVQCLVLSLLLTLLVWVVTGWVLHQPLSAARLPAYYICVLVVTAGMVGINLLVQRRPLETHAPDAEHAPPPGGPVAAVLARLPAKLRLSKIYAVQAEDHYIRFYTSAGSDLVLLRFSDALTELRGLEGAQVHRSWWVAKDAVETLRREHGKLFFVLRDGTSVPVSRSFTSALRKDGWF
ncbi:MAG: LytTR family DNA-binding domain-containing protein [Rhizomicrobium sp.]|jgi:hypothetical protein